MTAATFDEAKVLTVEEYLALPKDENKYELVEGELVEMAAGANEDHVYVSVNLIGYLWNFVRSNKLGRVYDSDARYETVPATPSNPKASIRRPDVSFVVTERVTPGAEAMKFGPDLAVEVLSPSNTFIDIEKKIREFFSGGSQLVWVIELEARLVHIYRQGSNQRETIGAEDDLDGEGVIPGFKLKVKALFE